ncbi:phosphatase PAP2 family protein [Salinilacihabitans rarus]|uniref:phosphatase PAP2 family protein n=1 Tax=Salinilacihabitans rarus TaxID=2961596 RepID=UPI0020C8EAA4|nr:phosphatase PAP2 family protein [Salinilacihabitans rarus]
MARELGGVEFVQGVLPESLAPVVALVTQLGDVWFLALVVTLLYVRDGRERFAVVAARALGGLGVLYALKYYFAFPRPSAPLAPVEAVHPAIQPLYAATGFAGGYGFPSGHALLSTVVYVSLAGAVAAGSARRRYAAAAALVGAVSLSRVALGVHYLVDVLAGVAVGLAFLGATALLLRRAGRERGAVAFLVAVACAAAGVGSSGAAFDQVLLLAATLGALTGWAAFRAAETAGEDGRRSAVHVWTAGLAVAALFVVTVGAADPVPGLPAAVGLAVAGLVLAPILRSAERGRPVEEFLDRLGVALGRAVGRGE